MKQCVIVVDDDADSSRMLSRLIRYLGYQSEWMTNGEAALEYLRRRGADVVILDLMMPGMDGMEVLLLIREDPTLAGLRVVMLSVEGDERVQRWAREMGADDYWVKGSLDFDGIAQRLSAVVPAADSSGAHMGAHR